jgi:4-hydroxybenzoate polyprenyltransferase
LQLHDAFLAFVLFCSASSSFYLINDIADIEADRQHPVKSKRPIAAGLVSIPVAILMAFSLLSIALMIGFLTAFGLGISILLYALLQIVYNLKLKRTPILDVAAIATGFVLRAYAGSAATEIQLSAWFLLCTAMLALFLAVEKRKAELRISKIKGGKTRSVLKHYSLPLLTRMESTVTTGAVISYALWSSGPIVGGAETPWMMLTLPLVLYGIFRYQLLSDPREPLPLTDDEHIGRKERTERPDEVLLTDKPILMTVIVWGVMSFSIMWLHQHNFIQ